MIDEKRNIPVGRFAPSPTGRMHLGNVYTALMSWLSVRSRGGRWILRIEDLDPQRSRREYAELLEDDLRWLGLDWDEGGLDGVGPNGPYIQSRRNEIYLDYFERMRAQGLLYPCTCRRADLLASSAPHASDGRPVYGGRCRPAHLPWSGAEPSAPHSWRIAMPDETIVVNDAVFGALSFSLKNDIGDIILRRTDGAWAYQLAVVIDDALMGVNEVMRGVDLLPSAAAQIFLFRTLGFAPPTCAHLPLLADASGRRLSKRDASLSMEELRKRYTPEQLLGHIAKLSNIVSNDAPLSLDELLKAFSLGKIKASATITALNDI